MRSGLAIPLGLALCLASAALAQQVPDRDFRPRVTNPAYGSGEGPIVCLDEAHSNFHTLEGRFWAFGELLRRDGYRVIPSRASFAPDALGECDILVISNAQPGDQGWNNYPYPTPSAFGGDEIQAVEEWVRAGGGLLLIADHMPLAGAAADLAAAFDVEFTDGFAVETIDGEPDLARPTIFRLEDETLRMHAITQGRDDGESVSSVRSFTGQAFRAPESAEPLLVLSANFIMLMPRTAWQFDDATRRIATGGWLQGAVMPVGRGRAAFLGEAAMFSAQVAGAERTPMGMNSPMAEQNYQFALNLMHWLSGMLE